MEQIQDFIAKTEAAVAAFRSSNATFGSDVEAAIPVATSLIGTALSVYMPGLSILDIPVTNVINTVATLAADPATGPVSDLSNAFSELKAAVAGGPGPTLEAWKAFDAAADAAHSDWQAAVAARRQAGS